MELLQISAWNDSGGGFLNRLLDGHPELQAWPFELLLGEDGVDVDRFGDDWFRSRFRWPRFGDVRTIHPGELFDRVSDLELKSVLVDPASTKHNGFQVDVDLGLWRQSIIEMCTQRGMASRADFLAHYVEAFFALFNPEGPGTATRVLGHCPVAILDAPEVWQDFPQTRFVHVIRSPLSGFHDMRARHPALDPGSYALKWSVVNGFAATFAGKYPDKVRLVFLPQLLEDRADTMNALLDWAGLALSDAVFSPSWRGRALEPSAMGPFGGVPAAIAETERAIPERLAADVREQIGRDTGSVQKTLEVLTGWRF